MFHLLLTNDLMELIDVIEQDLIRVRHLFGLFAAILIHPRRVLSGGESSPPLILLSSSFSRSSPSPPPLPSKLGLSCMPPLPSFFR